MKGNEKDTMKIYVDVKKSKGLAPKEKLIIKTKEGLTSNEKSSQKSEQNTSKTFLYKCSTNAERMTNTNVNTIHIIRNKKSSMESKK